MALAARQLRLLGGREVCQELLYPLLLREDRDAVLRLQRDDAERLLVEKCSGAEEDLGALDGPLKTVDVLVRLALWRAGAAGRAMGGARRGRVGLEVW